MMRTYSADERNKTNKHPVIHQAEKVENGLQAVGYDADVVGMITPKPGTSAASAGIYITPNMSDHLETTLDNLDWLSINEQIAETFGDASASAELTNVVERNDLEVEAVIEMLDSAEYSAEDTTDMLTKVIHTVEMVSQPDDPEPVDVAAYDILRKSLGWKAEQVATDSPDFHKMLASRDDQGFDLGTNQASPWDPEGEDGFQLKTHQRVVSQSLHKKSHQVPHLAYQWTSDGIIVATMDEIGGTDELATAVKKDAGLKSKTIVKKSEETGVMGDYGRPGRVLAWE